MTFFLVQQKKLVGNKRLHGGGLWTDVTTTQSNGTDMNSIPSWTFFRCS